MRIENPAKKRHRELEIESGARERLDEEKLIMLYLKSDSVRYALETDLNAAQILDLNTKVSHFVAYSVRGRLQRLSQQLEEAADKITLTPSQCKQMAQELRRDLVDYTTEPLLAVLQYYHKFCRPQQISAIKRLCEAPQETDRPFREVIEK